MEKTFRILKNSTVLQNNVETVIQTQVGTTTVEQLQKDLEVATNQLTRTQGIMALINHKIELANSAGDNDFIVL